MKHEVTQGLIAVVFGYFTMMVGGFDSLMHSLVVLLILDLLTGSLKAIKKYKFSPTLFVWGIVNMIVHVLVVIGVNYIQIALKLGIPIREGVLWLLIINAGLSFLRNASTFVKGLQPVTKYLATVKLNILKIFTVGDNDG